MTKIRTRSVFFALIMLLCLLVPMLMGNAARISEENEESPSTEQVALTEEESENGIKTLVDGFLAQLRAKYGEDYEKYYNEIITKWGSVEEYLMSLAGEDADGTASGWRAFVSWLGEYSPVWGSILAVCAVVLLVVLGKVALGKIANWATGAGGKFKTLFSEVNKMDAAHVAELNALIKLLGENERFKEEREALEEAAKEIGKDV